MATICVGHIQGCHLLEQKISHFSLTVEQFSLMMDAEFLVTKIGMAQITFNIKSFPIFSLIVSQNFC